MTISTKKYYRCYLIEFQTSTGIKYYAGKRVSEYENPEDDPYTGSGNVIRAAVKKYGKSCIKEITWNDCIDEDHMNALEEMLVAFLWEMIGKKVCVNIASGGKGGDTLKYASPVKIQQRKRNLRKTLSTPECKERRSVISKENWLRPGFREKQSLSLRKTLSLPEMRIRRSEIAKEILNKPEVKAKRSAIAKAVNARPDVKAKQSVSLKLTLAKPEIILKKSKSAKIKMRTSLVWKNYHLFYSLWVKFGNPKSDKFSKLLKSETEWDIRPSLFDGPIRAFNNEGDQPVHLAAS